MQSCRRHSAALLLAGVVLGGCSSTGKTLMPTPLLYQSSAKHAVFEQVSEQRRSSSIDLLYITDRTAAASADTLGPYGQGRAKYLAFGSAIVELKPRMAWPELVRQSLIHPRPTKVALELGRVAELGRYPAEPYPVIRTTSGRLRRDPDVLAQHARSEEQLRQEVERRLQTAPTGEIMLFVHGFNETFATAAYTAADLCHFLGRSDVCAFFTWPASAKGNPLFSYEKTTESALYSVGHLKKVLRTLAQVPGVEHIQLLAHSRGAALVLLAVRELAIEAIAAGVEPADAMKLENLILLSPDVDAEVASQQLVIFASDPGMTNRWPHGYLPRFLSGRFAIYASPRDRALGLSRFLFGSNARVGQMRPEDIKEGYREVFSEEGNIDLIVYEGERTDFFGHSYFQSNPRVSADLIELIRNGTAPDEPGRDLVRLGPVSWRFPESEGH